MKGSDDASRGINTGSSSNYDTSNSAAGGYVSPSLSLSSVSSANPSITSPLAGYTIFDRTNALPNGVTVTAIGLNLTSSSNVRVKIVKRNSSGNYDIVVDEAFTHPGGGWQSKTLTTPFAIPGSGTYYSAIYVNATIDVIASPSGGRGYKAGDVGVSTGVSGFTEDAGAVPATRVSYISEYNNMTLVIAGQSTDAYVSFARVLIEFDDTAGITLDTDLTAEVTCDGGAHWSSAPLLPLGKLNGQSGRKVAASAEIACTAGTSITARIKTFNGKNIPIHGVAVEAR